MKKTSLVLMVMLLCSVAQARTMTAKIRFYGQKVGNGEVVKLKQEIKKQFPGINLRRAELINVKLIAKSKHGGGKAILIVGRSQEKYQIYGNPRDFHVDRPYTFDRINMQPRRDEQGVWQVRFKGNIKVKRIVVEFDTFSRQYPRPYPEDRWDDDYNDDWGRRPGPTALNRYYSPRKADHRITTLGNVSRDYRFEATLGHVSHQNGANKTALFECLARGGDYMLSLNYNCEGERTVGQLGFISTRKGRGQKALFRCLTNDRKDHFVSLQRNCEGNITEARLGFI